MMRLHELFNQRSTSLLRLSGFLLSIFFSAYGALVIITGNAVSQAGTIQFLLLFSIPLIATGLYSVTSRRYSRLESAAIIILYHVYLMTFLVVVVGLESPIRIAWVLLFFATYVFLGRRAVIISMSSFTVFVAVVAYRAHFPVDRIIDLIPLILLIVSALILIRVYRSQEITTAQLEKAEKEVSLQRDRSTTLMNNLTDAIISTNKNGEIIVYNAALIGILDTNRSLVGLSIDEIMTPRYEDGATVRLLDLMKKAKSNTSREDLHIIVNGEKIQLGLVYSSIRGSYRNAQMRDKAQDGFIVILRDITKAKSLEQERDEFISVVSHELRTPITIAEGAISNTRILMDRKIGKPEVLRSSIDTAYQHIVFLARMINDLSTLSRAERGVADDVELINVTDMAHTLYSSYEPQAKEKGLLLNLDIDPALPNVTTSRLYLEELIQNFITNSIKYTKTGTVTLRVKQSSITPSNVLFAVSDTGIGVSKADQAKIFDKFYRSEDYRTRETGGTGLGLYVATKLAMKLGTKIDLISRLDHGSTFSFEIPSTNDSTSH